MKRLIIISFALIFALFSLGAGLTVYKLLTTTRNLRYLIDMHEIENIRQDLRLSVQKIQTYVYASDAVFAENLDTIIDNAGTLDATMGKCSTCHHRPEVVNRLGETAKDIAKFEEELSFLITTVSSSSRRDGMQRQVSALSNAILQQVEDMVHMAAAVIQRRTDQAIRDINRTYIVLGFTLLLTFALALVVARRLTLRVSQPIEALVKAARLIGEGRVGARAEYRSGGEFGELIASFNEMSESLDQKRKRIQSYLVGLGQLNQVTLDLHAAQEMKGLLNGVGSGLAGLLAVERCGVILPARAGNYFILHLAARGEALGEGPALELARDKVWKLFNYCKGQPLVMNGGDGSKWPFGPWPAGAPELRNFLVVWLMRDEILEGALLAINKQDGDILEEEINVLGILANNCTVAIENIGLYEDLELRMEELTKTQRQLIEAEKLTALGTLAGGVAHDFNNILCGIIGHVELLKRSRRERDKDYEILDTVAKAGFRAANLTRQLLAFAHQETWERRPVVINDCIRNVAAILKTTISKLITISLDLAGDLPAVEGDAAQLEQVVMNLCVNARDAMPDGGEIGVRTERIALEEKSIQTEAGALPGDYVRLTVSDTGFGMDEKVLSRIFEPFFTTKEFGKGTGLGLAMVYGIVKSHQGFCHVASVPGRGTVFTVNLPVWAGKAEKEEAAVPGEIALEGKGAVLIVDDEAIINNMLTELLEGLGFRVLTAVNGEEAIRVLGAHRDEVELVVLDINMPVMDGKEAFLRLRELKPDLKVLVSSGYSLDGVAREIVAGGAQGFIQKPYSLDEISLKIGQVLNLR